MEENIFKPLSQTQASTRVEAIAMYYPTMVRIYIPTQPILRLKAGMEKNTRYKTVLNKIKTNTENSGDRAIRKTKRTITDYALCNKFSLFVTFTFKSDRHNDDQSRSKMSNWLKNQRKRMSRFKYVIVSERHKDGALHFHGLLMGYEGDVKRAINPHTNRKLNDKKGRPIYQFPGFTSGFTTVKLIDQTPEGLAAAARYIKKYVMKDMPLVSGKNRYWASKDLNKPYIVDNPLDIFAHHTAAFEHTSTYGKTFIYPYENGVNHYEILSTFLDETDELLLQ